MLLRHTVAWVCREDPLIAFTLPGWVVHHRCHPQPRRFFFELMVNTRCTHSRRRSTSSEADASHSQADSFRGSVCTSWDSSCLPVSLSPALIASIACWSRSLIDCSLSLQRSSELCPPLVRMLREAGRRSWCGTGNRLPAATLTPPRHLLECKHQGASPSWSPPRTGWSREAFSCLRLLYSGRRRSQNAAGLQNENALERPRRSLA